MNVIGNRIKKNLKEEDQKHTQIPNITITPVNLGIHPLSNLLHLPLSHRASRACRNHSCSLNRKISANLFSTISLLYHLIALVIHVLLHGVPQLGEPGALLPTRPLRAL